MEIKLLGHDPDTEGSVLFEVIDRPWLLIRRRTFTGRGTVWADVRTGQRPGTLVESTLADAAAHERRQERRRDRDEEWARFASLIDQAAFQPGGILISDEEMRDLRLWEDGYGRRVFCSEDFPREGDRWRFRPLGRIFINASDPEDLVAYSYRPDGVDVLELPLLRLPWDPWAALEQADEQRLESTE